ncbi:MAG: phytanoyl-CoA dioxygenase family protein [Pseudomonadota bacterium]|nr:phytanoyl-CoA dioxygenase family protein [Pseudomonadota bacterium]
MTRGPERSQPREEVLCAPRGIGPDGDYPAPEQPEAFRSWFEREGFVVVRRAVPAAACQRAVQAFREEVLPDRDAWFERHATGKFERHVYTDAGFMKFPIMNLQDLSSRRHPRFKALGLDVLTQPTIQRALEVLLGEPGRAVYTMYFDGNQATWAHRDGSYFDAQRPGTMIGVWVAAEDIHPGAGRFYVVPGSHRIAVAGERAEPHGVAYKARMAEFVRNGPLDCVAPGLRQGDAILWTSLTIHGSLPTTEPRFSRRSFTAHYVPRSQSWQWNTGARTGSRSTVVNDVEIVLQRDESTLLRKAWNTLRLDLPRLYRVANGAREALARGRTE